jgi:hypothetical protein
MLERLLTNCILYAALTTISTPVRDLDNATGITITDTLFLGIVNMEASSETERLNILLAESSSEIHLGRCSFLDCSSLHDIALLSTEQGVDAVVTAIDNRFSVCFAATLGFIGLAIVAQPYGQNNRTCSCAVGTGADYANKCRLTECNTTASPEIYDGHRSDVADPGSPLLRWYCIDTNLAVSRSVWYDPYTPDPGTTLSCLLFNVTGRSDGCGILYYKQVSLSLIVECVICKVGIPVLVLNPSPYDSCSGLSGGVELLRCVFDETGPTPYPNQCGTVRILDASIGCNIQRATTLFTAPLHLACGRRTRAMARAALFTIVLFTIQQN